MSETRLATGRPCWCSWVGVQGPTAALVWYVCKNTPFDDTLAAAVEPLPLPAAPVNLEAIWRRKFRPDHLQHLLSVYLPAAALNPLDKLNRGNCGGHRAHWPHEDTSRTYTLSTVVGRSNHSSDWIDCKKKSFSAQFKLVFQLRLNQFRAYSVNQNQHFAQTIVFFCFCEASLWLDCVFLKANWPISNI